MTLRKKGKPTRCLYWMKRSGIDECMINVTGMFLPLSTHLANYCHSPNFINCKYYKKKHPVQPDEEQGDAQAGQCRRLNQRVRNTLGISIALCDGGYNVTDTIDSDARTIDVSRSGMRIESHRRIEPANILFFKFDNGYFHPAISGLSKVVWCSQPKDSRLFWAGLTFIDKAVPQLMENQLGMTG